MEKLTGTLKNNQSINQLNVRFSLLVVGILIISYSSDSNDNNETPADNMYIVRVFILVGNAFLSDKSWWYLIW